MSKMNLFGDSQSGELTEGDIMERVKGFCSTLKSGATLTIIGAAAVILNVARNMRTTLDVDVLNTINTSSGDLYDIEVVNKGILFLCRDYESRLVFQGKFHGVSVYTLGLLDLALVKLGRGLDKDFKDIRLILDSGKVPMEEFKEKYKEFRAGYGGNDTMLDENYYSVTGEKFSPPDRMF